MTTMTDRSTHSLDELMDANPARLLFAADAARAWARETGTAIVVMRDGKLVALLREGKYAGMTYAEQARTYQGFVRAHNEAWKGGGRPTDLQEVEKEDFLLQTGFDPEMHEVMCVEAAAERSDRSWYSSPYGD